MAMVLQVMLAVLATTALQDVHASRLKVSTLVENSNVGDDGPTELDQQHVTTSESKAVPGTIHSELSQVKEKESFSESHDSTGSIDAFSSSLVEMTSTYGSNKSKMDQAARHPACGGESTCSCAGFYDQLLEHCAAAEEDSGRESECNALVYFLWTGEVPPGPGKDEKYWRKRGYYVFLKNFRLTAKILPRNSQTLAAFWTGYSWTLGTRQVFDRAIDSELRPGAFGMASAHHWHLEDIEYKHHRIGAVMRHLKWDRKCHNSGHDSTLWLTLSKAYAEGTSDDARKAPVVVFINKDVKQLDRSFLFQHELALMEGFSKIILVDYKNGCSSELKRKVEAKRARGDLEVSCLKGDDQYEMGRLFQDGKYVAQLANDIKKLEGGKAPGIKWDTKEKVPLYAERRLEAASFEECQASCNAWKECNLFSYDSKKAAFLQSLFSSDTKKGECEMFHRKSELDYEYTSEAITSGRSRRKESCAFYTCPYGYNQISRSFSQHGESGCCQETCANYDCWDMAYELCELCDYSIGNYANVNDASTTISFDNCCKWQFRSR